MKNYNKLQQRIREIEGITIWKETGLPESLEPIPQICEKCYMQSGVINKGEASVTCKKCSHKSYFKVPKLKLERVLMAFEKLRIADTKALRMYINSSGFIFDYYKKELLVEVDLNNLFTEETCKKLLELLK